VTWSFVHPIDRVLRLAARVWSILPGDQWRVALLKATGPSFLVSVWAVVFDDLGRVLLFEHTHDRRFPWGLPSGRLEADETPEHAIAREFQEEVGGRIVVGPIVAALRDFPLPALRLAFRCELLDPPTRASVEVSRWSYFEPARLPRLVRPLQRIAIDRAAGVDIATIRKLTA
jgi:8-oxo-dGTP pyrophosphatase MutT (NUDIX family)